MPEAARRDQVFVFFVSLGAVLGDLAGQAHSSECWHAMEFGMPTSKVQQAFLVLATESMQSCSVICFLIPPEEVLCEGSVPMNHPAGKVPAVHMEMMIFKHAG
jgi:hypothetical protein